ncbi:Tripartite-type tricarboxylate transporter, receptor component TctC [Modicisalibacter muralis]|uniref:Tripartite-type tricarboxylate transporter, receptor component TctC n=1 Tax=Modicisalibacter muralis TaxID=119000 RepID=A0A1G9RRA3_9GAMM|nr:tripartite tricarboxylate transporter substrate binding protein [Halomonas muralis]SDM25751.1 Tripartite-type tricarboxylate transporter, receptor component TctC [Halomonas muralis]
MKNSLSKILLVFGTTTLIASPALADYPERPVEMIVAYSAGGGTDIAARTLVSYLEEHLGADITVVNRPGAGGEVGFTELASAKPDGYTIGFINTPNVITIPIQRDTRYEMEDFTPVASVIDDPAGFNVHPDSQFKTLEDLIEYAKAHPGDISYGTTGVGSDDHLAALALERQAGVQMTHVPFPGSSDVRKALMGQHIDLGIFNMGEASRDAAAGRIRTLAQGAEERWEKAPDVPTLKEQGYDLVIGSNRGIAVPAGVPDEIINELSQAIAEAMQEEEFQAAADKQSLPLYYQNPQDYQKTLNTTQERFQALWDESPWAEQ